MQNCGLDPSEQGIMSKEDFDSLLAVPSALIALQEVGIDVVGLVDFRDHLFSGNRLLDFPEFMDIILQLRGTNTATVKDVIDLRKLLISEFQKLSKSILMHGAETDPDQQPATRHRSTGSASSGVFRCYRTHSTCR